MKSNILFILGGLFGLSLIGRSFALTSNESDKITGSEAVTKEEQAHVVTDGENVCVSGPILENFKERRALIETKEEAITDRQRTLEAIEKRIEERMAALDAGNKQLENKLILLRNTAQEDVTHLTEMYQNMKPQQASEIFNKMDTVFAAGFLRLMDSSQAGLILANMDTDKAYAISIVIANKNAEFRTTIKSG